MSDNAINYFPAGPVVSAFHKSNQFVRGLMGPVGSSKSSACWMEIVDRAMRQVPDGQRRRRTRWAIIRNTYGELESTTIKTVKEWTPHLQVTAKAPLTGVMDFWLADKTRVQAEFMFISLDRPDDVGKIRGLELTGGWINEASEVTKQSFDMLTQRVSTGRYPPRVTGGPTWTGIVLDTNPPDSDHWWYKLFEEQSHPDYGVFKQPGGLLEDKGKYIPNPAAENIHNLNGGYEYYFKQLHGKTKEWIKVFVQGQYGIVIDGKPVYPEYNDELHCREIEAIPGRPLLIGLDYGLTPAAVLCQVSPRGQLLVLDEVCADGGSYTMGISSFTQDLLKPRLANDWRGFGFNAVGDPSGVRRAESDEKTCFMELAEQGIPASPASTNDFLARREAVAKYLTRLVDGHPALLVHPRCTRIRKGFMGGYCFKRLQIAGERYRDVADKSNPYSHPHDALQYAALFSQFMDSASFVKPIHYKETYV